VVPRPRIDLAALPEGPLSLPSSPGQTRKQVQAYAALGLPTARRRERLLEELADAGAGANTEQEAAEQCLRVLAGDPADVPFALLYLVLGDRPLARLVATTGPAPAGAPPLVGLTGPSGPWPLQLAWSTGTTAETGDDFGADYGRLRVLPIGGGGPRSATALLVLATALQLPVTGDYADFLDAVAASVGAALSAARTRQDRVSGVELDAVRDRLAGTVADRVGAPLSALAEPLHRALAAAPDRPLDPEVRAGLAVVGEAVDALLGSLDALAGAVPAAARPPGEPARGTRVLVVDPERTARRLLAWLLADAGWQVSEAADVTAAAEQPAEVLLVSASPGPGDPDGLAAVRALRGTLPDDSAVIVLTARNGPGVAAALAAGADDAVSRPYDPAELTARLSVRLAEMRRRATDRAEWERTQEAIRAEQAKVEDNLRTALRTRERIATAIGLVMAQRRCTRDEAFAVLREASQRGNVKLADLAETILETAGSFPGGDRGVS
jgi:DNA-binding response OmpR family regulator